MSKFNSVSEMADFVCRIQSMPTTDFVPFIMSGGPEILSIKANRAEIDNILGLIEDGTSRAVKETARLNKLLADDEISNRQLLDRRSKVIRFWRNLDQAKPLFQWIDCADKVKALVDKAKGGDCL